MAFSDDTDVTLWPSGLRRNVKAVVLIGGGSNPLDVIFFWFCNVDNCNFFAAPKDSS